MKDVKTPNADLERSRMPLLLLGLLCATALVLMAFEWKTYQYHPVFGQDQPGIWLEDETVMHAFPKVKVIPPPPPRPVVDEFVYTQTDPLLEAVLFTEALDPEPFIETIAPLVEYVDPEEVILIPDVMPEFPGGLEAMYRYLHNNIRYPAMARDVSISGKVFVSFVVNKQGEIVDAKVLNSIGGGCDEEALRVIQSMPAWSPGLQRGRPVNVVYTLPVVFSLR